MYFSHSTDAAVLQVLTQSLDPGTLLELASDVLSNRQHSGVRITDGPGDGGRDLHSVDRGGVQWVTQCKYHDRAETASSSKELGELPLALVKRGLRCGLFITNAKISPQAKREYLDSFPGLTLEFIDGMALVRELRASAVLSGLWLSSDSRPASYSFPVIVRRHSDDGPYPLGKNAFLLYRATLSVMESFPEVDATFADVELDDSLFEPYRLPDSPQQQEGLFLPFRGTECRVRGRLKLADVPRVAHHIGFSIAGFLRSAHEGVTVRVGTPTMTPLGGEDAGARIRLDSSAQSVVATKEYLGTESDFVGVDHPRWSAESDANQTEAGWIRLYAKDLDAAVNAEMFSPVTRSQGLMKRMMRAWGMKRWSGSVQALLPSWGEEWPYDNLDEPDESVAWPWGSLHLCGWLDDIVPARVRELKAALAAIPGATLVSPDAARHMLGVLGNDPFPDTDVFRFGTAELSLWCGELDAPSPIRPESRRLSATICFRCDAAIVESIELSLCQPPEIYGGHGISIEGEWVRLDINVAQEFLTSHGVWTTLGALSYLMQP
jgi:Restriction endonuclease